MTGPSYEELKQCEPRLFSSCVFMCNGDEPPENCVKLIYDSTRWTSDTPSVQVYVKSEPLELNYPCTLHSMVVQDAEAVRTLLVPASTAQAFNLSSVSAELLSPDDEELMAFADEEVTVVIPTDVYNSLSQRTLDAFVGQNCNIRDKLGAAYRHLQRGRSASTSTLQTRDGPASAPPPIPSNRSRSLDGQSQGTAGQAQKRPRSNPDQVSKRRRKQPSSSASSARTLDAFFQRQPQ